MSGKAKKIYIDGIEYVPKSDDEISENYYLVRTYSAGVFVGEIVKKEGKEVELKNARRIWYWDGAASLSQLAMEGTKKPENCKFPCEVKNIILTEAIEYIKCTTAAQKSIKGVPEWKK